jgi:hypothetical protein
MATEPMSEDLGAVTFELVRDRTAADLRQVAAALQSAAADVEKGDLGAAEAVIFGEPDECLLSRWHEMMAIRYAYLSEKLAETRARAAPTATPEEPA